MYHNRYINISIMVYVCIMNDTKLAKIFGRNYKVLQLFLKDYSKEFYLSEAASELKINKMSVYRALEQMVECGLLESRSDNYKKFYKLKDSPLMKQLKILVNLDSQVVEYLLRKCGSKSTLIILYGSKANGTDEKDSDWDFIIVSDTVDIVTINKTVSNLEKRYETQINVKLYSKNEYSKIKVDNTPFYQEVMTNRILLRGDIDEA